MSLILMIVFFPIFVILLVVIHRAIRSTLDCGDSTARVLSVCVSLFALIGMNRCLQGSIEVILIPYAALGILILFTLLLFIFFGKHIIIIRKHFRQPTERKCSSDTDDDRLKK